MDRNLLFVGLGLAGVVLHMLVSISKLKKSGNPFSFGKYMETEWPSILISIIVVGIADVCKSEIKQLEAAGNWLGLGFVALGYMGQSVLIFFIGQAEKKIGIQSEDKPADNA